MGSDIDIVSDIDNGGVSCCRVGIGRIDRLEAAARDSAIQRDKRREQHQVPVEQPQEHHRPNLPG
jgi:hypothetical protein